MDITEAIEFLQKEIQEKQHQIKILENLNIEQPVSETTWHQICLTTMRESQLMGTLLKAIFPEAEDIKVGANYVFFRLYDFKCYLPTSFEKCILIDTSWYTPEKIRLYDDWKGPKIDKIEEFLKKENPTLFDKVEFAIGRYPEFAIGGYLKPYELIYYLKHKKEVENYTNRERLKEELKQSQMNYAVEVLKKENKNREIYHKVQTMEHDLLPELYKFTDSVRSKHRTYCDLDPEEIIEKEHTRMKAQKNYY